LARERGSERWSGVREVEGARGGAGRKRGGRREGAGTSAGGERNCGASPALLPVCRSQPCRAVVRESPAPVARAVHSKCVAVPRSAAQRTSAISRPKKMRTGRTTTIACGTTLFSQRLVATEGDSAVTKLNAGRLHAQVKPWGRSTPLRRPVKHTATTTRTIMCGCMCKQKQMNSCNNNSSSNDMSNNSSNNNMSMSSSNKQRIEAINMVELATAHSSTDG